MELFNSNIERILIFSRKKAFVIFQEMETLKDVIINKITRYWSVRI